MIVSISSKYSKTFKVKDSIAGLLVMLLRVAGKER